MPGRIQSSLHAFKKWGKTCVEIHRTALGCLSAYLQGTDGKVLSNSSVKVAHRPLSTVGLTSILNNDEKFQEAVLLATKNVLHAEGRSDESVGSNGALSERISTQSRWWTAADASRLIDAGPVVERALQAFDWKRFNEEDYARGSTEVIEALQDAVEIALDEAAPEILDLGQFPEAPNLRRRQRPGVIQAIEAGVVQLLVARRNIRAALIEFHPRSDEKPELTAWNRLASSLDDGIGTATGEAVIVALVPGSAPSPRLSAEDSGQALASYIRQYGFACGPCAVNLR